MRPVLVVALLGIGLFGAGLGGVGRVDQQVAAADREAARAAQTRQVGCPAHDRVSTDREHL